MSALGDEFRSAREARGLTLSDVAEQIHIRSVYLNAIENEDWQSIGAPVYVRGFIRTYARFLGLESEAVVAKFNQTVPVERPLQATAALGEREGWSGPSLWALIGIAVAVLLVAFVGYEWWSYSQGSAERNARGAAAAPATPVGTASVQATAPAAASGSAGPGGSVVAVPSGSPVASPRPNGTHALAVHLTQRSWLRVVVDGKTLVEGIFPAGTERTFSGKAADVRAGNAGGVTVAVDGRPPLTLGKDGAVVEQHFAL